VVADDDGVAVIDREQAEDVLKAARLRLQKETETRSRLAAGDLGLDIYGFRQRLADLGVRLVDTSEE
jgi:4-hydroxy-4-methyl-2-oxoglutarate aldolase